MMNLKKTRSVLHWLLASLLLCLADSVHGADVIAEIRNEFLRVRWEDGDRGFTASVLPSGKVFAAKMKTHAAGGPVRKIGVTDRTFRAGEGLEVADSNGNRDVVMLFPQLPFVLARSSLRHPGNDVTTVRSLRPISVPLDLGAPATVLRTLGTGGLLAPDQNPGSYAWLAVASPVTRQGVVGGWLTHDRGSGVVRTRVETGGVIIDAQLDYGRLSLRPHEDTPLETFAIGCFDDARMGMEAWAAAVARVYTIKLPPQPVGYCTWYHAGASNAHHLARQTAFAARVLAPFGFSVIQIDDGWQAGTSGGNGPKKVFGTHNPKGPYPAGMKAAADDIKAHGLRPGLWFMPFAGTWNDPFFRSHQGWFVNA